MIWTLYRTSCLGANPGQLIPVSRHTVSRSDQTPTTAENSGLVLVAFAAFDGYEEIPDPEYHGGIRRECKLRGPVVSVNGDPIDFEPAFQFGKSWLDG